MKFGRDTNERLTPRQMAKIDLEFWAIVFDPCQNNLAHNMWNLAFELGSW